MRSKTQSSSMRLSENQLAPLYSSIRSAFPEIGLECMSARMADSRKRAFNGTTSHRWFKHNYVRSQVLKRYQHGTVTPQQRESAALAKYLACEEKCRRTNEKLYGALENSALVDPRTVDLLKRTRRIIDSLVGDLEYEEVFRGFAFSSGATTEFRRSDAAVQIKWAKGAHITPEALPLLSAFNAWAGFPLDHRFVPSVVDAAEYFTVLKNYERDRSCEKQPTLNMAFQKAIGGLVRRRLNRVGLLLPEAQSYHMGLARDASERGHLATGDLVSASDCVSLALVDTVVGSRRLKSLMAWTRCDKLRLPDGTTIVLEKLASMGNGFSFEVETLIFYGILRAVCGKEACISVFGDDLVYPTEFAAEVQWAFETLGFEFNVEKTFTDGLFRESCGGHYFAGKSVKPFYLEKLPQTLGSVINLHNDIIAYHENMPPNWRYLQIARMCRRLIPKKFWGPYGVSGVLWAEWDEACPRFVKSNRTTEVVWDQDSDPKAPRVLKRVPGPSYQRWVVKAVEYAVPVQRHDYFIGSILAALWPGCGPRIITSARARTIPISVAKRYGMKLTIDESPDLSTADFFFPASKREVVRTRTVDVACRWRSLPVRV